MNENNRFSTLYTDIDSILDTRMALLYLKFPDTLKWLLATGYPVRDSDIPNEEVREDFLAEWDARGETRDVLMESKVTKISNFVKEFIECAISRIGVVPEVGEPRIVLNIYPFKIELEEGLIILKGLMASIGSVAELLVVNLKPEEVTPEWIDKLGIERLLVYRYDLWIKSMITPTVKDGCPLVNMISPRIIFEQTKELLDASDKDLSEIDPHMTTMKVIEQSARPIINLDLITAEHFSIDFVVP